MATSTRPAPKQLSHQPLTTRLRPTPLTAVVAAVLVIFKRRSRRRLPFPEPVKWGLLVLAVANWRSVPFWWSARLGLVIQSAWLRYFLIGKKVLEPVVGKDPLRATSLTRHVASWNACDFMMHLSNSSYAVSLDKARLHWHIRFLGAPMRRDLEHVNWMVAATQFTFFHEVPMLADYQVATRPVAWDAKWLYLIHIYTTAPPKGSSERFLNCIAVSRIVYKLGRRTVPPSRVLSLAGFGPDGANHLATTDRRTRSGKRRGRLGREWLLDSSSPSGCETFDERAKGNLELVRRSLDGTNGAEALKRL